METIESDGIMRINHAEWFPMYLNPNFDEILELANSGWDTCRILHNQDNNDLVIASGYGNTHSSMVERYKIHLNKKRAPYCDSYILWKRGNRAIMNVEGECEKPWPIDVLGSRNEDMIKDLVRESNLSL